MFSCTDPSAEVERKLPQILGKSPCIEIDLPKEEDTEGVQDEMCFLTDEELHRLASVIGDRYRALVILAGYVGLRWGELAGLKRDRVKLRKIEVRETLVELNGHLIPGRPKTKASVRDIVLPAFVAEVLAEHMARYPDPSGNVFTAPEGGPLRRRNFTRRAFQPALERAGLPPMRLHDLRHTAASIALDTGAQAVQVQRMLGHRSIRTTLDVYGHLLEAREERLAADLDERARAAAGSSAAYLLPERPETVVSVLPSGGANRT